MSYTLEDAENRFRAAHAALERAKKVAKKKGKPANLEAAQKELARAKRDFDSALTDVRRVRRRVGIGCAS